MAKIDISMIDEWIDDVMQEDSVASSAQITAIMNRLSLAKDVVLRNREKKRAEEEKRKKNEALMAKIQAEVPDDYVNPFLADERAEGVHCESISEAISLSVANLARVDAEYISCITGQDLKTVVASMKGLAFQNPLTFEECFYKGFETADEYLSGNIFEKLEIAKKADKEYLGYFSDNIIALEKVMPERMSEKDIYITLGSPWVPTDIIDEFIEHMLVIERQPYQATSHCNGKWYVSKSLGTSRQHVSVASKHTYGTPRMEALYILENTLNLRTIAIKNVEYSTAKPNGVKVINKEETLLALEKQQLMIREFQNWVWKSRKRKERLLQIYHEKFGSIRRRNFDGAALHFPTMSSDVKLYPYQKNAVARILYSKNSLLAHDVGSGKTYIMIAAGMELRRTGVSKKNLYVVPNNILGQWEQIFKQMYPSAKILCVGANQFTPDKKEKTLATIKNEDFDAILMTHSCFERIPVRECKLKNEDGVDFDWRIHSIYDDTYVNDSENICFNDLGITRLFVDEAHNYKNLNINTRVNIRGISSGGSAKCEDMERKVRVVQWQSDGGVIFATGTPITNSITEAFVMQRYLQFDEIRNAGIYYFEDWLGMFAERVTDFEIDVDTSNYRMVTRFSKFHNLPELTAMLASVADFHKVDKTDGIPDFDGYTDVLVRKTEAFSEYLADISARAEMVRGGLVDRRDDNMLKITTDGRKAALDLRLVAPEMEFTYESKVAKAAENIAQIYSKTEEQKSAQLVFCDTSVPKGGFNVYDELRRLLEENGVPAERIAYVHDAVSESRREELFDKVRKGEIRILIGSTFKLGIGVNVQDRLVAAHHLDIPWRPADMTQREGRILRKGNTNETVEIYRYITEGSFDAYSWQLLETKQRFIVEILSGSLSDRSGADIEDTVLNYAEVKALAVGNPLVKERVETANELSRYLMLRKKSIETCAVLESDLHCIPGEIRQQTEAVAKCKEDAAFVENGLKELSKEERATIREKLFDAIKGNAFKTNEKMLMKYQGFNVFLPANMSEKKPFVWISRKGRYYVELGDTEVGGLIRIDNFFEGFSKHLEKLELSLDALHRKQKDTEQELAKLPYYADEIKKCRERLEEIDRELGVGEEAPI